MIDDESTTPTCPGCHFGCALIDYQCARGAGFLETWQAGEELPERHRGKMGKPYGKPRSVDDMPMLKRMPQTEQTIAFLGMVSSIMRTRERNETGFRTLDSIARHGGSATARIVRSRARCSDDEFDERLAQLHEEGFVESSYDDAGRAFVSLTQSGRSAVMTWREEQAKSNEEFLSGLSDADQGELHRLLRKLIDSTMEA